MLFNRQVAACTIVMFFITFNPANTYASEENKDPYADNLLGNWDGIRNKIADSGVDITVEYKADFWSNISGGIKRGNNYLDNLDVKFELDGEKLFGIKGNKSLVYFVNNNGGKPNANQVGSVEGIDNIETNTNTAKLYELWMEQSFLAGELALLVGLHDLNSEFMVNDMTGNFIHPTFQVNQELAQTGKNGPSVFPNISLAGRIKYTPTEETYAMAAVFDGVPGDLNRPHGTHVNLRASDGLLMIAEAGFTPKATDQDDSQPNKFALGAWTYTKRFDDLVDVDGAGNPIKKRSEGAYLLSSYQFFHDKEAGHDLGAFFRAGIGDGNSGQVDWFYATGVVANGWVPTRPDGEIGLGFTHSHNGSKYVRSVIAASGTTDRNEYGIELYYRDKLYAGVSIQPELQYIINPGTNPEVDNATIGGIRFGINF
jgi:porin